MSRPISELYRLAAKEWVELHAAATLLEETKTANLEEMKAIHVAKGMADNKATMLSKASPQWKEYIHAMVEARRKANLKWVEVEWIKMRSKEQLSEEANNRAEARL